MCLSCGLLDPYVEEQGERFLEEVDEVVEEEEGVEGLLYGVEGVLNGCVV